MPVTPWVLLSERRVLDGFTPVVRRTYRLPDGRESEWDVVAGDRTVAVLAVTEGGRFVMVRQFRPGPGRVLDELPGGHVDASEGVTEAAARELLEETGHVADALEVVGSTWMGAKHRVEQFCVVARGCRAVAAPRPDADEVLEVRLVDAAEMLGLVRAGQLTDQGLAYRALDHLGLLG